MEGVLDWQQVLLWSSLFSIGAVIVTIIGVPWVIRLLPEDYFARTERDAWHHRAGAPFYLSVVGVLKNVIGVTLFVLGIVMLVTPGQGVLTILAGALLMNFPGKYQLERWLVLRPGVLRAMNWLRARSGHLPFETPDRQLPGE